MEEKFISPEPPPTPAEAEILTILIEECAEVQQRATKMLRFGVHEIQPGQELSNKDRLSDEVGDLIATVRNVQAMDLLNWYRVEDGTLKKEQKLKKYRQFTTD